MLTAIRRRGHDGHGACGAIVKASDLVHEPVTIFPYHRNVTEHDVWLSFLKASAERFDFPNEQAFVGYLSRMAANMSAFHPIGLRAMARAFADADLRHVLPTITIPTLLLYGDEDVRAPLDVADAMHASITGSKLVVLRGVGHISPVEGADRFNDEARAFLRSVG